jgi:hypothetical protein
MSQKMVLFKKQKSGRKKERWKDDITEESFSFTEILGAVLLSDMLKNLFPMK